VVDRDNVKKLRWRKKRSRVPRITWFLTGIFIVILLFVFTPLPYYVTRPGSAVVLQPIIQVEGGVKDEKGSFMLTTVRMGEANLFWYLYAKVSPDVDLLDKDLVVPPGETGEDFTQRELTVMKNSQQTAEAVAFKRAGYKVRTENTGVLVMGTIPNMPARGVLKIGDVITEISGKKIRTVKELLSLLDKKKAGEKVEVVFQRDGKAMKTTLRLSALPDPDGGKSSRVGFGIRPENKQVIEVPKKVTIQSEKIGGPSAGLMFTLEIYDQLNKQIDLTRGYRVAGTGTIDTDGSVGRIGGINHKIIAADEAGAEIFFAPNDTEGDVSNFEEAAATAKRIGSKMLVIPVNSVDDAITYLKSLQPKRS